MVWQKNLGSHIVSLPAFFGAGPLQSLKNIPDIRDIFLTSLTNMRTNITGIKCEFHNNRWQKVNIVINNLSEKDKEIYFKNVFPNYHAKEASNKKI